MNLQQKPDAIDALRTGNRVAAPAATALTTLPHKAPGEAIIAALATDAARGLSPSEAQHRLQQYGPNQLKSAPETPWSRPSSR